MNLELYQICFCANYLGVLSGEKSHRWCRSLKSSCIEYDTFAIAGLIEVCYLTDKITGECGFFFICLYPYCP